MKRLRFFVLMAWLLAACQNVPTATAPAATATGAAGTAVATAPAVTPLAGTPTGDEPTPTAPGVLRLWLPPEFTPDVNTPGGRVLAAQLQAFELAHPGLAVEVRTKAAGGVGGLLNSLVTAANVAPSGLPD